MDCVDAAALGIGFGGVLALVLCAFAYGINIIEPITGWLVGLTLGYAMLKASIERKCRL